MITSVSLPDSPRELDQVPAHFPARLLIVVVGVVDVVVVGGCAVVVIVIAVVVGGICVAVVGACVVVNDTWLVVEGICVLEAGACVVVDGGCVVGVNAWVVAGGACVILVVPLPHVQPPENRLNDIIKIKATIASFFTANPFDL